MKTLLALAVASLLLAPLSAEAKGWYNVCKTKKHSLQVKDKKNFYVGGAVNRSHLHVGDDFVSVFSSNNNSKPVTAGVANCAVLKQAISDVAGGGFADATKVTACLNSVCDDEGCGCVVAQVAPTTPKRGGLQANPNRPTGSGKKKN